MNFNIPENPLFFLTLLIAMIGIVYGWSQRATGWGIPMMAVNGTVLVWYHGDAVYNDYANRHAMMFDDGTLNQAWLEVAFFQICFIFSSRLVCRWLNSRFRENSGFVAELLSERDAIFRLQPLIYLTFQIVSITWLTYTAFAIFRVQGDIGGLFFSYLVGYKAFPWYRNRIGGGIDFLFSLVSYLDLFCLASFGLVAVLTLFRNVRMLALLLMFLTWPNVLIDRARNLMLAVVLPAVLALLFIRLRGRILAQVSVLLLAFLAIDSWFRFVIANRGESVLSAVLSETQDKSKKVKHEGLNMFEELCWINKLMEDGTYKPNWGSRYFAELCNPIPRSIWPDKPTIGLDYSIARGQGTLAGGSQSVYATIATGMIGQGVVNFGPWFGPLAAGLIMSVWTAFLARLDLTSDLIGRLPLLVLGLALTFNMGRDITLLVTYPLLFGYLLFYCYDRYVRKYSQEEAMSASQ
ncbi:MAG: hypothetical protein U0892_21240 [Pirellulales bacterium]